MTAPSHHRRSKKVWDRIETLARRVSETMPQGSTELQYHAALAAALAGARIPFECHVPIPVCLPHGAEVGQRIPDLVVGVGREAIVIEIKLGVWFRPEHRAQTQGYLELKGLSRGMLLGFSREEKGRYCIEMVTPHSALQTRPHADKSEPATVPQVETMRGSYYRRFRASLPQAFTLTKRQASEFISLLQRGTDSEVEEFLAVFAAPAEPEPSSEPTPLPAAEVQEPARAPMPTPEPRTRRPLWNEAFPEKKEHTRPDRAGQRAEGPVSSAPPVPPAPVAPPPPQIPEYVTTRKRIDFTIALPLYQWLIAKQIEGNKRSISALIRPWIEEGIARPHPADHRLDAPPRSSPSKRINLACSDSALWSALYLALGPDVSETDRSRNEKDLLRWILHAKQVAEASGREAARYSGRPVEALDDIPL